MNEIRICDKCKATNTKTLVPRIKELDPEVELIVGCQNFCGIGRTKSFAIVNNIPIIAQSEDELIEKIKGSIKSRS